MTSAKVTIVLARTEVAYEVAQARRTDLGERPSATRMWRRWTPTQTWHADAP